MNILAATKMRKKANISPSSRVSMRDLRYEPKKALRIVVEAKAKPSKWSIRFCFMYL